MASHEKAIVGSRDLVSPLRNPAAEFRQISLHSPLLMRSMELVSKNAT
jgi:hypothetical protein